MAVITRIYRKAAQNINQVKQEFAARIGLYNASYNNTTGKRMLAYHGVCMTNPTLFNTLFITQKVFEQQLIFYKKHFNIVSLDEYCNNATGSKKFTVSLSFDDGFANNYHYVLPLLEKYEVPATFFITAIRKEGYDILWNDFLTLATVNGPSKFVFNGEVYLKRKGRFYISAQTGKTIASTLQQTGFDEKIKLMEVLQPYANFKENIALNDYWLQMTEQQIQHMAASPFVTIGSHGHFHNDLSQLENSILAEELKTSKAFLEKLTGKPVTSLAFPYGRYSQQVVEEAEKAGYKSLFATAFAYPGDENNPLLWERLGINPFISVKNQMHAIVRGNYAY